MHPVHDIDVVLLLALALSSKRRPAELAEIVAAAEVVDSVIPSNLQLIDSFAKLARHGLISALDGGFSLTQEAQAVMTGASRTSNTSRRIASIKEKLVIHETTTEHAPILLSAKEVSAAILAHRAASKSPGSTLLAPKPSADSRKARPGQRQRKPLPANRHKN